MRKTVIIALGGNAISPKKEAGTIEQQFRHTRDTLKSVMHFVRLEYNICITHGNGPQVGNELLRMDLTHEHVPPLPLGLCVAGTQGTIGYMIQQSLQNALYNEQNKREVVTFISQMKVDAEDASLDNPIPGGAAVPSSSMKLQQVSSYLLKLNYGLINLNH